MSEAPRYITTAPHYLPDGIHVGQDVEIGYGTQYPLPADWPPSSEVIPLNPAAEEMVRKTPAVNVRPIDENGFILPTVKNAPEDMMPNEGKPKDPASPDDPPKLDTKPFGKGAK